MKQVKLMKMFFFVVMTIVAGGLVGSLFAGVAIAGGLLAVAPIGGTDYNGVIKGLREQLAGKQSEMRALIDAAEGEKRDFNADEDKTYKGLETEVRTLQGRIKRLEEAEKLNANGAEGKRKQQEEKTKEQRTEQLNAAFRSWLRYGNAGLSEEERGMMREWAEERALSTTGATKGATTVPEGFAGYVEQAMATFGGILEVANVLETETGNDIPFPTVNDTSNKGAILGEGLTMGESVDPAFGAVTVKAFTYSSKPVLISNQLLDDNAVNLEQVIAEMLVVRVLKAFSEHSIVGAGTSTPEGITVGGAKGADAAAAAVTYDNLVDLLHSVDPVYRKNGTWMFHDNTLKALKKLKDENGQYIFQPSLRDDEPSTVLGKPFIVNNDMPEIGASAKSIAFGDFKKYLVRRVKNYAVKRLDERYADLNSTAFILFARMDGRVLDAGTHPIKYLEHAAA